MRPDLPAPKEKKHSSWALTYLVIFANLGSILFGYEIGATIWIMYDITNFSSSDDDSAKYKYFRITNNSSLLLGFVAAAAALGAIVCYSLLLQLADNISKRDEILMASIFYFVSSLLISISSEVEWNTVAPLILLIVGRFIYGGGISATLHSIPQYITEVLPASVRGSYGSSVELMVMLGMNIGFFSGYVNNLAGGLGWIWSFRVAYIFSIVMAVCSLFIPHNPVWLIYNDHPDEDILRAIQFITPNADEDDLVRLKDSINQERKVKIIIDEKLATYRMENSKHWIFQSGLYDSLTPSLQLVIHDKLYGRCLLLKVLFNVFKILTGQTVFLYFAFSIFDDLNVSHPENYVFGYIATRLVSAYVMLWIGDLAGRRVFLLASAAIMAISLYLAGFSYLFAFGHYSFIFIFFSGLGFQLGFGSISYFILNEITPFYIRSTANAIANIVLFFSYFIVTFAFPVAISYFGFQNVFFIFAVCNTFALYFVYFYIPETHRVDLEQCYRLVDEKFDSAPTFMCFLDRCCGLTSRYPAESSSESGDRHESQSLLANEVQRNQ